MIYTAITPAWGDGLELYALIMEGWIKLHRKFLKWEWFNSDGMVKLFIYLLLNANHEPKKWRGQIIDKGQLLTGREKLSKDLNMTEQKIRTRLSYLKNTGEITIQPTNQYSIITLCNFDTYQEQILNNNHPDNQRITNKQPTDNQRITTPKELKNVKNVKKKIKRGQKLFKNSGVTKEDIESAFKRTEDLVNADPKHYFNRLFDASESKGIMNIDWIATARSWARRDLVEGKLILTSKSKTRIEW